MSFEIKQTGFDDLLIIQPKIFKDSRGFFMETFNQKTLSEKGFERQFVQDNLAFSHKNAVRGLHFQAPPFAQGKLVYVLQGIVLDVVVDLRKSKSTFGKAYTIELSAENNTQFFVPEGFAHGYSVLSETALFCYKCTNIYNKASEGGLKWNDPSLNIDWKVENPIVSEKDEILPLFSSLISPFE